MTTLALSDGIWVALITASGGLLAVVVPMALKGLGSVVKHLASISENSASTKIEVEALKNTISNGLDTQTQEIGRVVHSVDNLTQAVDEHSKILKQHDERLSRVENPG